MQNYLAFHVVLDMTFSAMSQLYITGPLLGDYYNSHQINIMFLIVELRWSRSDGFLSEAFVNLDPVVKVLGWSW